MRKLNCLCIASTTKFYFSIDSPFVSKQELISLLSFLDFSEIHYFIFSIYFFIKNSFIRSVIIVRNRKILYMKWKKKNLKANQKEGIKD